MATNSWPAVGDNGLTDSQWVSAAAIGDGIVEDFGYGNTEAFKISAVNNTTDEITLTPGMCRVAGYVGESETEVLDIPAVGSPTTYTIGWCYDPALNVADGGGERSALGPVRLFVEDGPLDLTGGKRYSILYTITRSASQVLTAAPRVDHRRWVGPTTVMPVKPASDVTGVDFPRGSIIHETSTGFDHLRDPNDATPTPTGLMWRNISAPAAIPLPLRTGLVALDTGSAPEIYRIPGGGVGLRGAVKRSSGALLNNGNPVILADLPTGWRPPAGKFLRFPVAAAGGPQAVSISSTGVVTMYDTPMNVIGCALDGITFRTV